MQLAGHYWTITRFWLVYSRLKGQNGLWVDDIALRYTRMRRNAQHDCRPPLYYRRQTVVRICENFRYRGKRGRLGASLNDAIKLSDQIPPVCHLHIFLYTQIPSRKNHIKQKKAHEGRQFFDHMLTRLEILHLV